MPRTKSLQRQPAPDSEFMTTEQVAEWIGIHPATLRYWRHQNTGPASFKVGVRVVYRRAAVAAWVAVQEIATRRGGVG